MSGARTQGIGGCGRYAERDQASPRSPCHAWRSSVDGCSPDGCPVLGQLRRAGQAGLHRACRPTSRSAGTAAAGGEAGRGAGTFHRGARAVRLGGVRTSGRQDHPHRSPGPRRHASSLHRSRPARSDEGAVDAGRGDAARPAVHDTRPRHDAGRVPPGRPGPAHPRHTNSTRRCAPASASRASRRVLPSSQQQQEQKAAALRNENRQLREEIKALQAELARKEEALRRTAEKLLNTPPNPY